MPLDELLEAIHTNKVQDYCCDICNQRLSLGTDITGRVPSIKPVTYNGKKCHAVCINLWLTQQKSLSPSKRAPSPRRLETQRSANYDNLLDF